MAWYMARERNDWPTMIISRPARDVKSEREDRTRIKDGSRKTRGKEKERERERGRKREEEKERKTDTDDLGKEEGLCGGEEVELEPELNPAHNMGHLVLITLVNDVCCRGRSWGNKE